MTITFLGTGTSQGVPIIACECEVCRSSNSKDKRLRSSILIETLNTKIVIDSGPDFRQQLLREKKEHFSRLMAIEMGKPLLQGIAEVEQIFEYLNCLEIPNQYYTFDIALARGLDYYTGPIFETKLPNYPHIGSLNGGGRYGGLIASFGGKDVTAVGTSLGLDRIFTAMQQLNLLPEIKTSTKVLVGNFGVETEASSLKLVSILRKNDINAEFYPETEKLKKQFSYCDKKKIPFMCIIGAEEIAQNVITIKDLTSSEQQKLTIDNLLQFLKEH